MNTYPLTQPSQQMTIVPSAIKPLLRTLDVALDLSSQQVLKIQPDVTPAVRERTEDTKAFIEDVKVFVTYTATYFHQTVVKSSASVLAEKTTWIDKEYREAYAEAAVEQGIAWQVKINREKRGLTQKQLATAIGTRQSAISRMEDPEYGAHSLQQLMKLAHAFDCALVVKLAPYSVLARESNSLSPDHLYAASYDEEISGATHDQ